MSAERFGYFNPTRGYHRVKNGFSWPAFLFGASWACAKGLWLPMLAMLGMDSLIWFASGLAEARQDDGLALSTLVIVITYCVLRGRWANALWRAKLLREGYRTTRT
jgi:hypothetical protein